MTGTEVECTNCATVFTVHKAAFPEDGGSLDVSPLEDTGYGRWRSYFAALVTAYTAFSFLCTIILSVVALRAPGASVDVKIEKWITILMGLIGVWFFSKFTYRIARRRAGYSLMWKLLIFYWIIIVLNGLRPIFILLGLILSVIFLGTDEHVEMRDAEKEEVPIVKKSEPVSAWFSRIRNAIARFVRSTISASSRHVSAIIIASAIILAVVIHACANRYVHTSGRRILDKWTGKIR